MLSHNRDSLYLKSNREPLFDLSRKVPWFCACVFITLAAVWRMIYREAAKAGRETEGYTFICVRDKEVTTRTKKKVGVIEFVHSSNLLVIMDEVKGLRKHHIFLDTKVIISTILWKKEYMERMGFEESLETNLRYIEFEILVEHLIEVCSRQSEK